MDAFGAVAREAAMKELAEAPTPDGASPLALLSLTEDFSRVLADALCMGIKLPFLRSAVEAASAAFEAARGAERAALAGQHNASNGAGGPRLLPLCLELQVAIVNKAPSDR